MSEIYISDTSDCTGVAASWCPVHGECTCREESFQEAGLIDMNDYDCPLHGDESEHAA